MAKLESTTKCVTLIMQTTDAMFDYFVKRANTL